MSKSVRLNLVSVFALLIVGLAVINVTGQLIPMPANPVTEVPMIPIEITLAPDDPRLSQMQARAEAMAQMDVSDYQVVYFTRAANPMAIEASSAEVIDSWEGFLASANLTPPDAVIFDQTVLADIDPTWTQAAYRAGTVMIGINLSYPQMGELMGDQCMSRHGFDPLQQKTPEGDYFIAFYYSLIPVQEADREGITHYLLNLCLDPVDMGHINERGYHKLGDGFVQSALDKGVLNNVLTSYIFKVNEGR